MRRTFIAQAWVLWILSMAIVTLVIRNPLYILILLLTARVVQAACFIPGTGVKLRFWRLAILIVLLSVIFNVLLVHVGNTVILILPENWWVIGGALTLEAAVYGAISGLILVTLLAVFLTFNTVVPANELIRLAPRALTNVSLVVMIALTFVPETAAHLQRIREAQALRGHRLRGLRDWQPVVIPLLIGGLERAMTLAETMVARGYGATTNVHQTKTMRVSMLLALVMALGGWILTFWIGWAGYILILAAVSALIGLIIWLGQRVKYTRYRPRKWTKWDLTMVACSLFPLVLVVFMIISGDESKLFYTPYPQVTVPSFDVLLGLALASLAAPAILVEL